jgi:phenylacetate-CoA ligase
MSGMLRRLHGSAVLAGDLRGQRRVPYWSREKLEALRDERIRRMVAYAARAVPYYRAWFAREGIDPRRIRCAADLDLLPILDRDLVRTQPQLFVAEAPPARGSVSFLTSGSTGSPVEIHHDRRSLLANIAYGEREREPVNRSCGTFRPRELYVGYETSTFKRVIAFYEENVLLPVRPRRRTVSLLEPIEKIAQIANAECPDLLVGYGGWLDLFFKTVVACGIALHPPRMVMYMGEALPHGGRDLIEKHFRIPLMSRYNAVEAFKIGFFCEQRTGFHVHEDLCHIRIAGPNGASLPPGQQGQVVISNLVNRATVLLNYPLGDVASLLDAPCSCGRTFRLLSELEGRVEDMLPLADGRVIHPRAVWQVFKDDRDVLQYRLTQHELQRFQLEIVTADERAFQGVLERAMPALNTLLGPEARIEASHRHDLDRRSGEKFRAVASLCKPPAGSTLPPAPIARRTGD